MADQPCILLIEDNPIDVLLLKKALSKAKFQGVLLEATHADMAYQAISAQMDDAQRPPSLVLLDLELPGENGLEVLKKLKLLFPDLPVIVFSSSRHTPDMARARELGVDWYYVKPDSVLDLEHIIRDLGRFCKGLFG